MKKKGKKGKGNNRKVERTGHITWSEAPLLTNQNLILIQRLIVNLHAWNSSSEISSVPDTSSHSYRVVSRQPKSSNTFACHKPRVHEQTRHACPVAVRCTNKLPFSRTHASTGNSSCETSSSSTRKACKQRVRSDHPEMNAPAVRHIVEYWARSTSVVYPR